MKKTIEQWLNELPDGYRELALGNMDDEIKNNFELSMQDAIAIAFAWGDTDEGEGFWFNVYRHYDKKPLPPLPKNTNGE